MNNRTRSLYSQKIVNFKSAIDTGWLFCVGFVQSVQSLVEETLWFRVHFWKHFKRSSSNSLREPIVILWVSTLWCHGKTSQDQCTCITWTGKLYQKEILLYFVKFSVCTIIKSRMADCEFWIHGLRWLLSNWFSFPCFALTPFVYCFLQCLHCQSCHWQADKSHRLHLLL